MFKRCGRVRLLFFFLFIAQAAFSQVLIKGRVTDAANGDPIPFASVGVLGLNYGATTNFQGEFTLYAKSMTDSLFASVVGYKKRVKWVDKKAKALEIDFQLDGNGKILSQKIHTSSGFPVLDNQALEMVKKSNFPVPPEVLKSTAFNVTVPVSFKLE